jgi:phenylacetate-coenzyme A ligase PaaK-like adenylate-forming protein
MFTSDQLLNITSEKAFEQMAFALFNLHFKQNAIYRTYCDHLGIKPNEISQLKDIPFLPIQFFKGNTIYISNERPEVTYTSSGTTGNETSKHLVRRKIEDYLFLAETWFKNFFPNYEEAIVIGLLPNYLERKGSSLIDMVQYFIEKAQPESRFSLEMDDKLKDILIHDERPKILFGVTFALVQLAEKGIELKNTSIIETGGMKGMRKEIIRPELHTILENGLNTKSIYSEYGMTELLSQGYWIPEKKAFQIPPWMKIFSRNTTDPLETNLKGKGGINVIDLANQYSCPFIATEDIGTVHPNGTFDIAGRLDHTQTRGCNLLVL